MSTIPVINFKPSLSEDDFNKLELQDQVKTSKVFESGVYDLKILEVVRNITPTNPTGTAKNDPTWSVFKITLGGADTRTIRSYLLAPTVKDTFDSPTMDPKYKYLMIKKFRSFMRGVGVDTKDVGLAAFSAKLHADPDSLVGREVRVQIGYTGPHLKFNEEPRGYVVVDRRENPVRELDGAIFPDRDSAKLAAASEGLVLQGFAEVRDFEDLTDVATAEPKEVW